MIITLCGWMCKGVPMRIPKREIDNRSAVGVRAECRKKVWVQTKCVAGICRF